MCVHAHIPQYCCCPQIYQGRSPRTCIPHNQRQSPLAPLEGEREEEGGEGKGREEGRREEDIEVQQLTDGADHAMSSS